MPLSETQKKYLRGLGHQLKPTVIVGDSGLTENLVNEFETTLSHHELIKIKVRVGDREARDAMIGRLCDDSAATLVQRIGNVALLYRENPDKKKIQLPRR
ncbi:MAG: ribosome assembly RNA-binding protein YhbY [Woeseiaceae bacterium]|nr:ribosome assembly RNA-binding protein YhbY [Woeseiaceae bacterium]